MEITTSRIQDTSRKRKGKCSIFPLAIRVTHNRVPVKFPIGIELTPADFKKLDSPRLGERLSAIKKKLAEEEERAKNIIAAMGTFTFTAFKEEFYKNSSIPRNKQKSNTRLPAYPPEITISEIPLPMGITKKYGTGKFDKIRSKIDF